jgi:GMP synthase-like glutamine amidotransferase
MRALVIVHDPGSEAVLVGDRLEHHGYEQIEVALTTEPGNPVGSAAGLGAPTDYDLIVPMGSTHSLTDPDRIASWIHDELEFLRRADADGVPVFGVCFGGQALAAAHGGRVVRADRPQVGWHHLTPYERVPIPAGRWMQWHYDRFEPPADDPDVEVLAVDDVGIQAFALRRNLGVQFHPEVTRAHVQRWVDMGAGDELRGLGLDPDELLDQCEVILDDVRERTNALVDWFLTDIATR